MAHRIDASYRRREVLARRRRTPRSPYPEYRPEGDLDAFPGAPNCRGSPVASSRRRRQAIMVADDRDLLRGLPTTIWATVLLPADPRQGGGAPSYRTQAASGSTEW